MNWDPCKACACFIGGVCTEAGHCNNKHEEVHTMNSKIEVKRVRIINRGNFLGFADAEVRGFELRGWRVLKGEKGVFAVPPSREYRDNGGKKQYWDAFRIGDRELDRTVRKAVVEAVIAAAEEVTS